MKHFGELAFIRGIIYYKLSPYEQKPFAGAIKYGLPNFVPRILARIQFWLPPFVVGYIVYKTVPKIHEESKRKKPSDFLDEVDPNTL